MQLEVTQVVEDLAVVNVRHRKALEAMAKVYGVLESLCLNVITASVTVVADNIVHNMFIEVTTHDLPLSILINLSYCSLDFPNKMIAPISFIEFSRNL